MKKILLLMTLSLSVMSMKASEVHLSNSLYKQVPVDNIGLSMPLIPTYLENVSKTAGWDSNWFIEAKGGASAFIGSPIGCGDIFDRTMPVLQVGVGKWFSPSIGGRIEFQGLKFKNANLQKMNYQFIHADFMWNVTGNLNQDDRGISKWDIIPYVGVGMVRNSDWSGVCKCPGSISGSHPFAFSYGVQVRYHVYERLHLLAEVSGMSTLKNFDAVNTSARFGDHMVNASVGLSFTIGKQGWKKVIDARPYIKQNDYLMDELAILRETVKNCEADNASLTAKWENKNNYSGLNSLRYRMSMSGSDCEQESSDGQYSSDSTENKIAIGVPVYFYFKLNTNHLVDESQMSNLDEIAKIAKAEDLNISISGAADSATGTEKINRELSKARAKFIGQELIKRGISKERIKAVSRGGINDYSPVEANRNTCVIIVQ